jgi:hypothetical protein
MNQPIRFTSSEVGIKKASRKSALQEQPRFWEQRRGDLPRRASNCLILSGTRQYSQTNPTILKEG